MKAMWSCPRCERTFANRNRVHTYARLGELDRHFERTAPHVRETIDRVLAIAGPFGDVQVLAEKTRIALHARMSSAVLMPRRNWLNGHLVLPRHFGSPRFTSVTVYSPRNVVHAFRLDSPAEVDEEFTAWLAEAYQVGVQQHLRH